MKVWLQQESARHGCCVMTIYRRIAKGAYRHVTFRKVHSRLIYVSEQPRFKHQ